MELLVFAPYAPWPLHGGTPLRMYHVLRGLRRRGHRVTLLAGHAGPAPPPPLPADLADEVRRYPTAAGSSASIAAASLLSRRPYPAQRYAGRAARDAVDEALRSRAFDAVVANFSFLAALAARGRPRPPVVLEQHESEALVWRGYLAAGRAAERAFAAWNLPKASAYERAVLRAVDAVACVSGEEAALARRAVRPGTRVWLLPNGVDVEALQPTPLPAAPRVLLCASMDVRRNADAAVWFARRVLPLVQERVPAAEFWVVGREPGAEVRALTGLRGVHVTGTVEDVRPHYRDARVVVAPYRFGGGTRLKVLEALAAGRPLVASASGGRGLDLEPGQHMALAEDEGSFAREVADLLVDGPRARALAAAGRKLVEHTYAWDLILDRYDAALRELVEARHG